MSASLVNDVTLYDPNGALVPLSNAGYWQEEELYPWYNSDTGQWNYPDDWTTSMGYSAVIEDEIIPGTYNLVVTTNDGQTLTKEYQFYKFVTLPMIDPTSFQFEFDANGNLFWRWETPIELYSLDQDCQTSLRAIITIYRDDQYVADLCARIPTHIGHIFIPARVVQQIVSKGGNKYKLKIQVRTNDNNNRSYSNTFVIE